MQTSERTLEGWAHHEAEEMNLRLKDKRPFGRSDYKFTVEDAWFWEDYAYKKGRRPDRGNSRRRFLELLGHLDGDNWEGNDVLDMGVVLATSSSLGQSRCLGIDLSGLVDKEQPQRMMLKIAVLFSLANFPIPIFPMVTSISSICMKFITMRSSTRASRKKSHELPSREQILLAETLKGGPLLNAGRNLKNSIRYLLDPAKKMHDIGRGGRGNFVTGL